MIKINIIRRKKELSEYSHILQQASLNEPNYKKSMELRNRQNEMYKKWEFYDKYIKTKEKINEKIK